MLKKLLYPLFAGIISCNLCYAHSVQKDLADGLLRLHIVANGNSEQDQSIKLKIRDEIIKSSGEKFEKVADKKECKKLLAELSGETQSAANRILKENGFDYGARVEIKRMYIPRKSYDGIILPEGAYDAMVVKLGEAKGENWWCVVYPPLCFTEEVCGALSEEGEEYLKQILSPESYSLIKKEGISIEYKFKTIKFLQKIKNGLNL